MYAVVGTLREKLKNEVLSLGDNNLVSVIGDRGQFPKSHFPKYQLSTKKFRVNAEGTKKEVEVYCINFYRLEVTEIIEVKTSDEKMPSPKRDVEEEEKQMQQALRDLDKFAEAINPPGPKEIEGTISSINVLSPVKTVTITPNDSNRIAIESFNQSIKWNLGLYWTK